MRQHVRRRCVAPIGHDPRRLDDPLIAVAAPVAFTVTSLGVEDPGLDLLGQWVPANSLRYCHYGMALDMDRKIPK